MKKPSGKYFYAALTGTIITAICCFTPALVIVLSILGLSVWTPYLDYVLFPALGIFIVLTIVSFLRWKRASQGRT